ncbi:conjugal transfer protein TraD, partial [Salmonella enterica]
QERPKVAPEFIPREMNPEVEARLSAVLAMREAEGRQMASLFEPDAEKIEPAAAATQAEQPQQPQKLATDTKKSATSDAVANTTAGGVISELETKAEEAEQLPPGINESGEVVDMDAYERWQAEQESPRQQHMQRREEVNINVHRSRQDVVEPGDDF